MSHWQIFLNWACQKIDCVTCRQVETWIHIFYPFRPYSFYNWSWQHTFNEHYIKFFYPGVNKTNKKMFFIFLNIIINIAHYFTFPDEFGSKKVDTSVNLFGPKFWSWRFCQRQKNTSQGKSKSFFKTNVCVLQLFIYL